MLPLADALLAIDFLEAAGFHVLGWEGWVKTVDGRVGHGSAGRYASVSLDQLSPPEAASFTRRGITEDAARWSDENVDAAEALHFCITARLQP